MNFTRNERIGVVISAIWLVIVMAFVVFFEGDLISPFAMLILCGGLPVVIGWGGWWIRQSKQ